MLHCGSCNRTFPLTEPMWRCDCGSHLRLEVDATDAGGALKGGAGTLQEVAPLLGIRDASRMVTLGEGKTPMLPGEWSNGQPLLLKLDHVSPTGSFKDRGSAVMVSKLREWNVGEIVEDSSGNAGASVAAYCAAAGIRADVYIPAHASPGKAVQIAMYGARLVRITGPREETTRAAMEAAARSFYASHNWSPYFVAGLKTLAWEIASQLYPRPPDWVVAPAGGGSLILGLHDGFLDLQRAGLLDALPRLVAVQARACAPLLEAWERNLDEVPAVEKGETVAEGISITRPVKGRDVLAAVRHTKGLVRVVSDEEIWKAFEFLARRGIYVEPTAAAAPASIEPLCRDGVIRRGDTVVVVLTGSGLKATSLIAERYP